MKMSGSHRNTQSLKFDFRSFNHIDPMTFLEISIPYSIQKTRRLTASHFE